MAAECEDHDLEMEKAVLGAALRDKVALLEAVDLLKPTDFYVEAHRTIFEYMEWFVEEGRPVDTLLLGRAMREAGELAGGITALLSEAEEAVPDVANVRYYAEKVRDLAIRRGLALLVRDADPRHSSASTDDLIDGLSSGLVELSGARASDMVRIGEVASGVVSDAIAVAAGEAKSVVVRTGIEALDNLVFMRHGQLIVLAGATSSGKSSLALQIADNVARAGGTVVYFSPEMSREELATRELSERTGFYMTAIERGTTLDSSAQDRLSWASRDLAGLPLWVDDSPGLTPMEIRARSRLVQLRHGLDLVVVDYLQIVKPTTRNRSREQEVAEISRDLKLTARYLRVPMLVCAQLSRKHVDEHREPHLQDLRESGAIENDADTVLMLYRPDRESPRTLIYDRKQRQGPLGTLTAMFDPVRMRFNNTTRGEGGNEGARQPSNRRQT